MAKDVPCVFSLLPNKQEATYDAMLGELSNHVNGHAPNDALFDFDLPRKLVLSSTTSRTRHWKTAERNGHIMECDSVRQGERNLPTDYIHLIRYARKNSIAISNFSKISKLSAM